MDNRRKSATNNVDRTVGVGNFEGKDERLKKNAHSSIFLLHDLFTRVSFASTYTRTYVHTRE